MSIDKKIWREVKSVFSSKTELIKWKWYESKDKFKKTSIYFLMSQSTLKNENFKFCPYTFPQNVYLKKLAFV